MDNMAILIKRESSIGKIKNILPFLKNIFKMNTQVIVNRKQFIESVYHLSFYGNILNELNYTIGSLTSGFSENQIRTIAFSIQWNIMIINQSIIDELNGFLFNYKPDDISLKNRIKSFKKIISPALNEIKKWKDIKEFRNNILAHNGRNYYRDSVILSSQFNNYDIPLYHSDFLILFQLLKTVIEKAEEIFAEEKQEADKIMDSLIITQNIDNSKKRDFTEAISTINNIIVEMNKREARYNSMQ